MQPTTTGENRTGAATAEEGVRAMLDANERWAPPGPIDTTLAEADRGSTSSNQMPSARYPRL